MSVLADTWEFLTTADNWTGATGILEYGWAHVWISLVAVVLSAGLSIPPAIWMAHRGTAPILSVSLVNMSRAIPSFAVIALVLPLSIKYGFGLGFWPTCVALVALGIPPMFTNAYTGVSQAAAQAVEAAHGIGMTNNQVLAKVELPAAVPLILTGVRISAVQIVATATLGALVGYECLGTYIVAGLARGSSGRPEVLAGAILVTVLAIAVDAGIGGLSPRLAPWTRRLR